MFGQGQSVDFRTPDEAWMALGFSGTWAITYDGGNNWIEMFTTDTIILQQVVEVGFSIPIIKSMHSLLLIVQHFVLQGQTILI